MNKSLLLHYDCLSKFDEVYNEGLLTKNHIVEAEKYVKDVRIKGDPDPWLVDDVCTILHKDGKRYLMPSTIIDSLPIKIKGSPIIYSYKDDVYRYLDPKSNIISMPSKAEMKMSFRAFADYLSSFEHTGSERGDFKLYIFMILAQMYNRVNFRISTTAGFGKDSIVEIMGALFGDAHTIENPTIAKLEKMTFVKLLAVNEVIDIKGEAWRDIEQFLLATGALKNKVLKRSRASAGVGEELDISKFSITLMYNDIDHYSPKTKYFDKITKKAVKDRFPSFRLCGRLTQDFNEVNSMNKRTIVMDNYNFYTDLVHTFTYFKKNFYNNEVHYKSSS